MRSEVRFFPGARTGPSKEGSRMRKLLLAAIAMAGVALAKRQQAAKQDAQLWREATTKQ